MKKLLIGATFLSIAIYCPAETKQALTLHMKSGAEIVYFLDTEPVIGFEGQTMVITVDEDTTVIPMGDVNHWVTGMVEYSGITMEKDYDHVKVQVNGNTVNIFNPDKKEIIIYNISGQIMGSSTRDESSFTLKKGIYVVKIGTNSYKIVIR